MNTFHCKFDYFFEKANLNFSLPSFSITHLKVLTNVDEYTQCDGDVRVRA